MTDTEFIKTVNECKTMAYASKKLGMAYSTFIRKAKKLKCYKPNQGAKGTKKLSGTKIPLNEILDGKHPQFQSYKLKKRLIEESLLKDECSICGWDEKPSSNEFTPCELDHINGDSLDHRLCNLRILCPNCHSLTKTYRFRRGKNNLIEHQDTKVLE